MAKVDLAATMKQAQESGALGTGSFKLKEGPNRVRIVQGFLPHTSEFTDPSGKSTQTFKWLTRILDRRDGSKVKVFFLGHTIYKQLVAFQQDSESGTDFDELPMPYDININATGAGTMLAKYTVVPSQRRTSLTNDEETAVASEDSLEDLQEALYKKKGAPAPSGPVGHDEDHDSDLPF